MKEPRIIVLAFALMAALRMPTAVMAIFVWIPNVWRVVVTTMPVSAVMPVFRMSVVTAVTNKTVFVVRGGKSAIASTASA